MESDNNSRLTQAIFIQSLTGIFDQVLPHGPVHMKLSCSAYIFILPCPIMPYCWWRFVIVWIRRQYPLLTQFLLTLVNSFWPPGLFGQLSDTLGQVWLPQTRSRDVGVPSNQVHPLVIHIFSADVTNSRSPLFAFWMNLLYKLSICLFPMMFEQMLPAIKKNINTWTN